MTTHVQERSTVDITGRRASHATPWDAAWHLRAEVSRIVRALSECNERPPARGEGSPLQSDAALSADEIEHRAESAAVAGAFLPLQHARRVFALDAREYDALVLAVAVEVDAGITRLVAGLVGDGAAPRPTLGLALAVARVRVDDLTIAARFADGACVRDGLFDLIGDGPLATRQLQVAPTMLRRLVGAAPAMQPGDADTVVQLPSPAALARLVLTDDVRDAVLAWGNLIRPQRTGASPALLIASEPGGGRSALARAGASAAARTLVTRPVDATRPDASARALRREARWHGAIACADVVVPRDAAVDWPHLWRALADMPHGLVVTLQRSHIRGAVAAAPADTVVVRLTELAAAERAALWRVTLPPLANLSDDDVERLASRYRFTPARIERAVRSATASAKRRAPDARHVTLGDITAACDDQTSGALAPLAREVPLPFTREDLIVPAEIGTELDLAAAWLAHRHTVMDTWGFGRRVALGRGLTALFAGRPGTGKTMAAQVLARHLGTPLLRVDLAALMSKYIGETEKHLATVFDEAHASGAVLFFDEADALFGKRTEVKDAHDRYANVEIGYLLQRMEEYEGATVLATNRLRDLDEAFIRRLHFVVQFPIPSAADRLRIWKGMVATLPDADRDRLDLDSISDAVELSGGEIRNAALAAAFLAASEKCRVGTAHVARGVLRELKKNGRVPSAREGQLLASLSTAARAESQH